MGEVLWFPLGEVHHLRVGFKELGFTEGFARKRSIEFCVQEIMLLAREEYHV